jgi:hypothetical protein
MFPNKLDKLNPPLSSVSRRRAVSVASRLIVSVWRALAAHAGTFTAKSRPLRGSALFFVARSLALISGSAAILARSVSVGIGIWAPVA